MLRPQPGRPTLWQTAPPESDVAVALFRTAFIVGFSVLGGASGPDRSSAAAWIGVSAAALYTFLLFTLWWRRRASLPWLRPLALLVDIIMVSCVVATYDVIALRVKDVFYLVIFAGGMWYQATGALLTALVAMIAYVIAYSLGADLPLNPASALRTVYDSGAFFMPAVGYAVGVLFRAYSRDLLRLAEIDHEIGLARALQDQLVPSVVPPLPGWEFSYCMGRAREVGGDIYDFVPLADGSLLVAILDMAGKSVYGLVHLSLLHSQLHDVASHNTDIGPLVTELARRAFPELQPDSYAAGVFLKLSPSGGRVEFVNCGHLSPLVLMPGAPAPTELSTGHPIIGAYPSHEYTATLVDIPSGGAIVCYTDGLVEARNARGSFYGEDRLRISVAANASLPPGALCSAMLEDVRHFGGREASDDQTVLVLRRPA